MNQPLCENLQNIVLSGIGKKVWCMYVMALSVRKTHFEKMNHVLENSTQC